MIEKLEKGLATLGLDFDDAQKNKIEVYINEVLECNKTYNLMKADSEEELAVNHILDTLAAAPHLAKTIASIKEKNSRKRLEIGDIGSGGGCPGIPLAVAFPNEHFTLVERMEKRCVFLSSAIRRMGLENVEILCLQADKVPKDSFDIEVFRAFHPFDKKIASLLLGMCREGGVIAAYKARAEKIQAEMEEVKNQIPKYEKIKLQVPFLEDHERNLVVITKTPRI